MRDLLDLILVAGPLINRSLSAAIAIISGSFLLYTLVNGLHNRVARNFSGLLFFVLIVYIGDLGVTYSDTLPATLPWLKFQWLGIAFVPASYVHLSDSILELTGLPSRGRRKRIVRILYAFAFLFVILVAFSQLLLTNPTFDPAPHFKPGPIFLLFFTYFVGSVTASFWFVFRAQSRTLTRTTRRRMTYLLFTYAAPALAVFPFLLISGQSLGSPVLFYGVLIVVDTVLAIMLVMMGYLLAFFGTGLPDRQIRAQMLNFVLRGPLVAIATLAVIVWLPGAGRVLRLPGEEVMPFVAVTTILFLQWAITLINPLLDRWLIYGRDQTEIQKIQALENRLVTETDFQQLLESILTGLCDYMQVKTAFVASITMDGPRLELAIGLQPDYKNRLEETDEITHHVLPQPEDITSTGDFFLWEDFWIIPLYAFDRSDNASALLGILGITAPEPAETDEDEEERDGVLTALALRTTEILEDRQIQSELFASLEGVLTGIHDLSQYRGARFGQIQRLTEPSADVLLGSPDFTDKIKEALKHYYGGPRLTDSSLMQLAVVQKALEENEGNPQKAMRAVLLQAIENLKPEGKRSMTTAEWILYNILELRFIQGRKVRDVALRLAMSEPDLYRKQRDAISSVAEIIASMERATLEETDIKKDYDQVEPLS